MRPPLEHTAPTARTVRTTLRGRALLATAGLNKGTAFTAAELADLGLIGLLPPAINTLDGQLQRTYEQYREQPSDLAKNLFLDGLHDRNEVLYYWGVNGIDISIGKLAVYTAAAGLDPCRAVPVVLDVGTDRVALLDDPRYLGNRHPRVRGAAYDAFVDAYVAAAAHRFPAALLHFEDLGPGNARRVLDRHRDRACVFNDDLEGTGAVALAAILAGVPASGIPLAEHRVVVLGAGTAGVGIADQVRDAMVRDGLDPAAATAQVWLVGRGGLITTEAGSALREFQVGYARDPATVRGWRRGPQGGIPLAEVVHRVHPTVLVGTSTAPGAFTEPLVREMAAHTQRPLILPMSNPTSLAEAAPTDLLAWTDGRALIATGSPFPPVTHAGITHVIAQANNALVFPGIGLGVVVARAARVTDTMLAAAAVAIAELVDTGPPGAPLLPGIADLRTTSAHVAERVVAAAVAGGLARRVPEDIAAAVAAAMWWPQYPRSKPNGPDRQRLPGIRLRCDLVINLGLGVTTVGARAGFYHVRPDGSLQQAQPRVPAEHFVVHLP